MQELFHDEQAQPVPTTAVSGQSQTRSAQYSRNYRKNPEKNRKINEDRRRNYKMKKEKPDNVSSMFESAAHPVKAEQQTVEKVLNKSNKPSLSESQSDTSRKSEPTYELINVLQQGFEKLDRNFDSLQSDIRRLKESVKPATPVLPIDDKKEQQTVARDIAKPNSLKLPKKTAEEQAGKPNFIAGFFQQISQMDGAAFARNFPAALVLGFCAYHACLFVVEQTIPLYESLKFPNPQMACYGAVGIAVGFSALSAISKTEIIKLFTAVIIAYEVLIVCSGSQANQKDLASEALRLNPTHFSVSESYSIAKIDYEQKKTRYEDKNSEVYHNGWFKSNHLDPANKKMDEASAKLVAIESELGKKYSTDWIHLVLKALYRLSAVALVMLLAKESIKRGVGALTFRGYQRKSV